MDGLILLLALCVVMALASFLAGALPLSMALTSPRLRLISSLGVGVLVGTSLIVIIPEGIGAATASPDAPPHIHRARTLVARSPWGMGLDTRDAILPAAPTMRISEPVEEKLAPLRITSKGPFERRDDDHDDDGDHDHDHDHAEFPAFEIGISMLLGFVLMFLIDRIPRHAIDGLNSVPQTRHISLANLTGRGGGAVDGDGTGGGDGSSVDEEADGLMGSLAPPPRRARPLATTLGLVIHAAADGIAMGASATSPDTKMSLVIFVAIMIHKAPAAFGLTSLLLRQGLSKRAARSHLVVFSLAAPIGALATWTLVTIAEAGAGTGAGDSSTYWTGILMLFSGGTFLYVAMHAMQEDSASNGHDHGHALNGDAYIPVAQKKASGPQFRDTLVTVVGMFLPLLTQIGHHH